MTRSRLALALWIAFALVVWNVVFDRVLVLAGREFVFAAVTAANAGGPYLRAGDWMSAAAARGVWLATAVAAAILVGGVAALTYAVRRGARTIRS